MELVYLGHSGFAIKAKDYVVIVDYLEDKSCKLNEIFSNTEKVYVLVSHQHHDHFNSEIFNFVKYRNDITYILSSDIELNNIENLPKQIITLSKGESFEDGVFCVTAYGSTDVGVSFLMKIDGENVFHAGDLNNWHWEEESTIEEIEDAEKNYLSELNILAENVQSLKLAMYPVDPRMEGDYARGARQFLERIKVEYFVPMHTWGMWEKAFNISLYLNSEFGQCICLKEGECVTLN